MPRAVLPPASEDPLVPSSLLPASFDEEAGGVRQVGFWRRFSHQPYAIGGLVFLFIVTAAAIGLTSVASIRRAPSRTISSITREGTPSPSRSADPEHCACWPMRWREAS